MKYFLPSVSMILLLMISGCSSTESATERDRDDEPAAVSPYLDIMDDVSEDFLLENMSEIERLLFETRNSLSDESANLQHDMPEIFTREAVTNTGEIDEYAGYRVQILSTRDVVHADSTRDSFLAWADSTVSGYVPNAYVFFRQPYYRLRAGDFRDRERAIEFSRILKQFYPDAWVVHDRIEPNRTPADTTTIRLIDPKDRMREIED